ncbi:hypothetical protein C3B51_04330 [Pseudoalteromonas rubra]|uniref:Carrier domain-containing protein n=4 Tax=Pseudoalteromonas rubra TaxID=43658 RepID=A0A4Q7EM02_9GAMM|nr:hypothetical protein C3B51_04330 [Pseudoalteromonas rubra]
MLPSAIVSMTEFPLNSNGKIDRKALPAPEFTMERCDKVAYVAPQSPAHITTCEILASLLGVDKVGLDDNFFVLGGHSILAMKAIMAIKQAIGIDINIVNLFEAQSVRELCVLVDAELLRKQLEETEEFEEEGVF